jgi:hypothetical protein
MTLLRRPALVALACASSLALAGCGEDDEAPAGERGGAAEQQERSTPTPEKDGGGYGY